MRRLTSFERFCAAAFNLQCRYAERKRMKSPVQYPGGLGRVALHYHCIEPTCTFIAGSIDAGRTSAQLAELGRRAARSRKERPVLLVTVFVGALGSGAVVFLLHGLWTLFRDGEADVGKLVGGSAWLLGTAWMFFQFCVVIGRHFYMVDAMQQWGDRLGGRAGCDTVEPVVEWIARFWPWFAPPHFLQYGTTWATGWHAGLPVLLTSERDDKWIVTSGVKLLSTVGDEHRDEALEVPSSMLCRLSLFIAGGRLRGDGGAPPVIQSLGDWGYGVVTTPAGVYLYGLAYERGLQPQYLAAVVDKMFSALAPVQAQAPGATQGGSP